MGLLLTFLMICQHNQTIPLRTVLQMCLALNVKAYYSLIAPCE